MCIVTAPAKLHGTKLYIGKGIHQGQDVHVLGYQNTVQSFDGPNCMLLHFPTAAPMTPDNVVDTSNAPVFLDDLVEAVAPKIQKPTIEPEGVARADLSPQTHVFDHDIYTIILTNKAADICTALEQVPQSKRPNIKSQLLRFYARAFQDHSFALCCFDNASAQEAKPLLWWYEPQDPDTFMAPALDSHTGDAPYLGTSVQVDHWVITGTSQPNEARNEDMVEVQYSDPITEDLEGLLPTHVTGRHYGGRHPNGDFMIGADILTETKVAEFDRVAPALT